jgi:4-amino-4-deoxy-L-arabinose transferase
MENVIFGIITVLICVIGYFFSWKLKGKEQYTGALILLLIGGFLLRLYTASDFFIHEWDERYHAVVAKNLLQHPFQPTLYDNPVLPYEYTSWTSNSVWVHKQPLPLWSMAISMYVFGVNEIALRLPSILLSTCTIALVFSIGSFFYSKRTAFLAAFFVSINGLIIELTGARVATDHYDVFFLFFITLSVYFSIRFVHQNTIWCTLLVGLSMGMAILTKWLPALIVVPIWFFIMLDSKKYSLTHIAGHFFIIVTASIIVFLPWQLYIFDAFPLEAHWESSYNFKHITEVLEEREGSWFFFINQLRINYGELIYLPLIWFGWSMYKSPTEFKKWAILVWIAIPLVFFSLVQTKMQAYILFTCPALFMITAEFYYWLNEKSKSSTSLKGLFYVVMILLLVLPIRYSIERIKPFEKKPRNPQWAKDLRVLGDENLPKAVLFNYKRPIEAMFYTDITAYSEIPDMNTIVELQQKGYKVLINNDGTLSNELVHLKGIRLVEISSE